LAVIALEVDLPEIAGHVGGAVGKAVAFRGERKTSQLNVVDARKQLRFALRETGGRITVETEEPHVVLLREAEEEDGGAVGRVDEVDRELIAGTYTNGFSGLEIELIEGGSLKRDVAKEGEVAAIGADVRIGMAAGGLIGLGELARRRAVQGDDPERALPGAAWGMPWR
jgi:hypothetical protein